MKTWDNFVAVLFYRTDCTNRSSAKRLQHINTLHCCGSFHYEQENNDVIPVS